MDKKINDIINSISGLVSKDQLEKLKSCKTVEEVKALAKKFGITIPDDIPGDIADKVADKIPGGDKLKKLF